MMARHVRLSIALVVLLAQTIAAQLPPTAPGAVGISAERLARMDQVIQASIEKERIAGRTPYTVGAVRNLA